MKQVRARVVAKGERLPPLYRLHGRSIRFSQTIMLHCPEIAQEAQPGQFVMVRCGEERVLPRPFSIHQVNTQGDVSLYFAVLEDGKGTEWLSQQQQGDVAELFGPLGDGFSVQAGSQKLLLVAGGMGIASLYFLAQEAVKNKLSVTLLYGTAIENPYPKVSSGIKLIRATEDGSVGHHGMVTDLIPKHADEADQIFACGPIAMYRDMARKKRELKLEGKPVQVSLEVGMGCGRGLCYGCSIKTRNGMKKVCQDGPVFDLADILWDELDLR